MRYPHQYRNGKVYFFQPQGGGNIKIGWTQSVEQRLEIIAVWSPEPLVCLGAFDGFHTHEQILHRTFAEHRVHREWFRPVPEILELIAVSLRDGRLPQWVTEHTEFVIELDDRSDMRSAVPKLLRQCGVSPTEFAEATGLPMSLAKGSAIPNCRVPDAVRFFNARGLEIRAADLFVPSTREPEAA